MTQQDISNDMTKAILYKEWLKLRWYFLLAFLVSNGMVIYCMLRIDRLIELKGAAHIWEVMALKNVTFIDLLQYVPLITGIVAALVQFFPEMQRKCLKLTLHLPCPQQKMTIAMLASALAMLAACFLANLLAAMAYLPQVFPCELTENILSAAAPWYLAGFAGYLFASWICLEPTWKYRVVNGAVAAITLRIYFLGIVPKSYNGFLPYLSVYTLLLATLSSISIRRFKAGRQD